MKIEDGRIRCANTDKIFFSCSKKLKFIKKGRLVVKNKYQDQTDTILSLMEFISPEEKKENATSGQTDDDISSRLIYYFENNYRWVPTNDFVGEQYQNEFPLSYEKESVLAPHCKRYLDRAKAKEKLNKKKPEIIKGAWPKYYWNWDQRVVFNLKDLKKDQTFTRSELLVGQETQQNKHLKK